LAIVIVNDVIHFSGIMVVYTGVVPKNVGLLTKRTSTR
jgi:hypothetical protein